MITQPLLRNDPTEFWRAAVIDLDGTLLDNRLKISERSIGMLEFLHRRNMVIVIATGRLDADARQILENLDFTPNVVSCSGALVKTDPLLPPVWEQTLPPELSEAILRFAQRFPLHVMLFAGDGWHCLTQDPYFADYVEKSGLGCHYHSERDLQRIVAFKILLQGEDSEIDTACIALRERFGICATISKSSSVTIDIVCRHQNKLAAVERFLAARHISLAQTIAFGDAMNDLELLSSVGHGVLMGNAMHELQRHLPDLPRALPNHQDGVARYLEQLLLR
jgi:Cof subfamily protein (haloacid dehalogenase superfamily)